MVAVMIGARPVMGASFLRGPPLMRCTKLQPQHLLLSASFPIRRDGTAQQAQCSPPRIALSVSPRRALWSAIRSASLAGARSRGAAAPCLAVRCPLDVFLEATFGGSY